MPERPVSPPAPATHPVRMRMMLALLVAALALLLVPAVVQAREAASLADDPVLEARMMAIAEELRCLVCQNETIAASNAGLAVDLRQQIRERLTQGETPEQIRAFMVQRYGNFVLYRPPLEPSTWALWAGPFVLLLAGFGIFLMLVRRRRREETVQPVAPAQPLDDKRRRQIDRALREATEQPR